MLTKELRNNLEEAYHDGDIIIFNGKDIEYSTGDVNRYTFMRSSAKPVQLIATLIHNLDIKFGLNDAEIAVMTASHRAEKCHIEALNSIIEKTKLNEEEMIVKPTYPLGEDSYIEALKNNDKRKIYHNCSGKHLNLMLLQRYLTGSTHGYELSTSESFQEIMTNMKYLLNTDDIKLGTDGCGVPVFYVKLLDIAKLYYHLANPETIKDESIKKAVIKINNAVHKYPFNIAGKNRICSLLNHDPEIFAKGGAKGTYAFGMKNPNLGIAIKVLDGSEEPWGIICKEIVKRYKITSKSLPLLENTFKSEIYNDNGIEIGNHITCFKF